MSSMSATVSSTSDRPPHHPRTTPHHTAKDSASSASTMPMLLLLSIVFASANTLLYKITLNAYSSPTTNYAFFTSQFSILLYAINALIVSGVVIWRKPSSWGELKKIPQSIFINMGLLDAACGTLSAIAGVRCPGELQTILNQMVIPITMVGAAFFLRSRFQSFQIWGCVFIICGALIASSDYLFGGASDDAADDADFHHHEPHDGSPGYGVSDYGVSDYGVSANGSAGGSDAAYGTDSGVTAAMTSAAVVVYLLSVVPSAFSNIYKESKMKDADMDEFHTSTVVSFYQLAIGFFFLPLMAIPALGGLTTQQMSSQLGDGFSCFLGNNPPGFTGDCSNAAWLLLLYIAVNFFYNILLLMVTKRGSAVLLVISQALSLPVTNIAFTLKIFMGDHAEPLTGLDLAGLVLVCIGFLTYSGYGFATNFMVAQGAPGQMTYLHFEDVSEVIVSTEIAQNPHELVSFLVGSILRQSLQLKEKQKQKQKVGGGGCVGSGFGMGVGKDGGEGRGGGEIMRDIETNGRYGIAGENVCINNEGDSLGSMGGGGEEPSPLSACRLALDVARKTVLLLEVEYGELSRQAGYGGAGARGGGVVGGTSSNSSTENSISANMNTASPSVGRTTEEVLQRLTSLSPRLRMGRAEQRAELAAERCGQVGEGERSPLLPQK